MNLTIATPDFRGLKRAMADALAAEFTATTRRVTRQTEKELEALTVAAGLSRRLSRTWQSVVYPKARDSLNPAGLIWSTAPGPMRAFTEGAVIRGRNGGFLAIPTEEVLKVRGVGLDGSTNKRITPGGFERATGIKLRLIKGAGRLGFLIGERAIGRGTGANKGRRAGFREVTAGRLKRGARAEKFLAFVLVPSVTIARRFDIKAVNAAWAAAMQRELGQAAARAIGKAQLSAATGGRI